MPILCLVDAQIFVIGGKITLYLNELSLVISPSENIRGKKSSDHAQGKTSFFNIFFSLKCWKILTLLNLQDIKISD